ncbi:MAG: NADPH-dependent FMN reductase [Bullifex sp.]
MKKILFIVASRRKGSFNMQLAKLAEKTIGERAQVTYLDYDGIPLMDQDIEYPAPEEIVRVRKEVMDADAIWIFSPEYNHSYPGALKNLIDWLSRPLSMGAPRSETAISGKPFTVSNAAGASGGSFVREHLIELLTFIGAKEATASYTGVKLDREAFRAGVLKADIDSLEKQASELLEAL